MGTGWYEVAVFAENGLCRFVHRISSFLPETYVIIVFILTYRDGDRGGRHIVISTEAKRRNLPAEWGWWLGRLMARSGPGAGSKIEER